MKFERPYSCMCHSNSACMDIQIKSFFLFVFRRGADRGQRDSSDHTPLDYAEQRGHMDCVRILRSYGLQRPSSAMSLASRVSVSMATDPPILDDQGHVVFRRFSRQFSLSSRDPVVASSSSSMDRLPADGQAQSESPDGEVRVQEGREGEEGAWEQRGEEENAVTTEMRSSDQLNQQNRQVL